MAHLHHHHHHHIDTSKKDERSLWWAVIVNVILTFAQFIGGLVSGSLALIADAVHNFSDAASLFIALVAIRIGRRPADSKKTFGYKRAETVAALINLNTLIIIGLYMVYEAIMRFINPQPIEGWIVVWVAGIALVIDAITAMLTYRQSKHSMNIRAAFLHNLTDALASVAVIIAGTCILLYNWVWLDAAMTLLISAYILWHGIKEMPRVMNVLMEGKPHNIDPENVRRAMEALPNIKDVHHMHIWHLDEHRIALEAHVLLTPHEDRKKSMDALKFELKLLLRKQFDIGHSTLEFEDAHCNNLH